MARTNPNGVEGPSAAPPTEAGLQAVVDQLVAHLDVGKCREYMRFCIVSAVLSDALTTMAVRRWEWDVVPLAELYDDAVAAEGSPFASLLVKNKDFVMYLLDRAIKYLAWLDEKRGEAKHVVVENNAPTAVTKEGLLTMAAHLDTARAFLGCIL